MQKKVTGNLPLKIMSVAVAVLIWLIVVNIDNPIETKYFTIPDVELINKEYVESSETIGKMCMPEKNQATVRVAITAPRKTLSRLTESDIHAAADLQQAVSLDTNPVMVPITATCDGIAPGSIKVSPQNLSVHLDEKETQEFVINVSSGDSRPGKDYEVGSLTASPEKVRITGPKSLMHKIDKVNATVSIEGITQDYSREATLAILDKNQDTLSDSEMNSLRIENNAKVIVTAKLWKIRKNVKLAAGYTGTPEDGYQVGAVRTVPDTISVAGSTEALENLALQGNIINIPVESIDITGESADVEKKISILDILPEGIRLTSDSSEGVWVYVSVLPFGSQAFTCATKDIEVRNKPDDLQVTFETAQIEVRVKAEDGSLEKFDAESGIRASIDLKDKTEGSYEVPVKITLPRGYEVVEDVTAEVVISAASATEENKE